MQPNQQQPQQPKKPLTAAQRLEGLEQAFRMLDQEAGKMQNRMNAQTQAIVLLSKKLEAVKRAAGISDEQIAQHVKAQDLEDLKDKVKEQLDAGVLEPAEVLDSSKGFAVIRVLSNDLKEVVNERQQFPMFNQNPNVKKAFEGKKVGEMVTLEEGGQQHEILEIYTMVIPKAPQKEGELTKEEVEAQTKSEAPAADPAPEAGEGSGPASSAQ